MARLIRMDNTGHTTLAEWTAGDTEAVERAVAAFRESSTPATTPWSPRARGTRGRSELPVDADLVILRRPIAGG